MLLPILLPESRARAVIVAGAVIGTLFVFGFGLRAGEADGRLVYQHGAAQSHVSSGDALPVADVKPRSPSADSDSDH